MFGSVNLIALSKNISQLELEKQSFLTTVGDYPFKFRDKESSIAKEPIELGK